MVHPEYNRYTFDNDFAVIKLDQMIDFEQYPNIRPACFPTKPVVAGDMVWELQWCGFRKSI